MTESLVDHGAPDPETDPAPPELELVELTPEQARDAAEAADQNLQDGISQAQKNYSAAARPATEALYRTAAASDTAREHAGWAKQDDHRAQADLQRARQTEAQAAHQARKYLNPDQAVSLPEASQALDQSEAASQQLLAADQPLTEAAIDQDFDQASQAYDDWLTAAELAGQTPKQRHRAREAHRQADRAEVELDQAQKRADQAELDRQQTQQLADEARRAFRRADQAGDHSRRRALIEFGQELAQVEGDYQEAMASPLAALTRTKDQLQAAADRAQASFDQIGTDDPKALEQALLAYEQAGQSLEAIGTALAAIEARHERNLDTLAKLIGKVEADQQIYRDLPEPWAA